MHPISRSSICHARGLAKMGWSRRAPYPSAANHRKLAEAAPAAKKGRSGTGCVVEAVPINKTVSRYTCGFNQVKAAMVATAFPKDTDGACEMVILS